MDDVKIDYKVKRHKLADVEQCEHNSLISVIGKINQVDDLKNDLSENGKEYNMLKFYISDDTVENVSVLI